VRAFLISLWVDEAKFRAFVRSLVMAAAAAVAGGAFDPVLADEARKWVAGVLAVLSVAIPAGERNRDEHIAR
jgi:hypothetical protein